MELLGKSTRRETCEKVRPFRDLATNSRTASPRARAGTVGVFWAGKATVRFPTNWIIACARNCAAWAGREVSNRSESPAPLQLILLPGERIIVPKGAPHAYHLSRIDSVMSRRFATARPDRHRRRILRHGHR